MENIQNENTEEPGETRCENVEINPSENEISLTNDNPFIDEGLEILLHDIETTINLLMSSDRESRAKGKIMYALLSTKEHFGIMLTQCYFRPSFPDHVQEYCLVLLKDFFSKICDELPRQEEKKIDADELLEFYLDWLFDCTETDSLQIIDLLTIFTTLNPERSHKYIEQIFVHISSNDPLIMSIMLKLLKNIIKKSDTEKHNSVLYNISHYIASLFKFLANSAFDCNIKASILSTFKSYILKITTDELNNDQIINEFIHENISNYDLLINELVLRYDSNHFIDKLFQYILVLHENINDDFILSKKANVYSKLIEMYSDMSLLNEYLLNSITSDELINLRRICGIVLSFISSYISYGLIDGELDYIIQLTITSLHFLCLEQKDIIEYCSSSIFTNFSLKSNSESSADSDDSDMDIVNIHNLRPIFLSYLSSFQSNLFETLLKNLYTFIEQIITISNTTKPYNLKLCETGLWMIYKTCHSYFALPDINEQIHQHFTQLVINCIKFSENGILHWQAIMAFISLCIAQPNFFDFIICHEIQKVLQNENELLYAVIFASEALQRIIGIMKFNQAVYQNYKSIIPNLCDCIVNQYRRRDGIEDRYKIHFIKTLTSVLISSEDFLIENLNSYFLFMFDVLKNNSKNYHLSDSVVNSFDSISKYSSIGNAFIKYVYPHIINAIKNDFSSESFASNSSLCEIFQTILILSNGELNNEDICYLYHTMYRLLENDDDQTLLNVVKFTTLCIHLYARFFSLRDYDDGTLTSFLIITLLHKTIGNSIICNCIDFFELLKTAISYLPNIIAQPNFFKLLFYVILELQKPREYPEKEYYLLSFCCFVSHYPIPCINYLKRLPGLYYKYAVEDIFDTWYWMHLSRKFACNVFQFYSVSSAFILLSNWLDKNDPFLNSITVHIQFDPNGPVKIPLIHIAISILIIEVHFFQKSSQISTYPSQLYFKYWSTDFKLQTSLFSLFTKFQQYIHALPKAFLESIPKFLPPFLLPTFESIKAEANSII